MHDRTDDGGCVIKRWIIVHEPGKVPQKKNPHPQTNDGATDFLISLALCRPKGTRYTVAELTWDHDLWVQEGHEALAECRLAGARKFAVLGSKRHRARWLVSAGRLRAIGLVLGLLLSAAALVSEAAAYEVPPHDQRIWLDSSIGGDRQHRTGPVASDTDAVGKGCPRREPTAGVGIDSADVEMWNYSVSTVSAANDTCHKIVLSDPDVRGNRVALVWKQHDGRCCVFFRIFADVGQYFHPGISAAGDQNAALSSDAYSGRGRMPNVLQVNGQFETAAEGAERESRANLRVDRYPGSIGSQRGPELALYQVGLPRSRSESRPGYDGGNSGPAHHAALVRLVLWTLSVGLGVSGFVLLEEKFKRPANTRASIDYGIIALLLTSGVFLVLPLTPIVSVLVDVVQMVGMAVRAALPV